MNETELRKRYRRLYGFRCDRCGCEINSRNKQIALRNEVWGQVVNAFPERKFKEAKNNLICPECVEVLLGRKIQKEDLLITSFGGFVPINAWWIVKNDCIDDFIGELKISCDYLDNWGKKYGMLNHHVVNREIYPQVILDRLEQA